MPGSRIESGDTVTLRTVEPEDAAFLQRAHANPELRHPLGRTPTPTPAVESQLEELTADDHREYFLVCVDPEDSPPGHPAETTRVGLVLARDVTRRPNLAFWIAPEYHGEGYATEAATLAIDAIFRSYDIPSIGAGVYDFNEASKALLESLGFSREGRQRRVEFHDGEYHDNLKYGILREEWAERRS